MRVLLIVAAFVLAAAGARAADTPAASTPGDHPHQAGDLGRVGRTHFAVTCAPELQGDFDRSVALLHSFFYEESEKGFQKVADRDPKCAMAHWGIAMGLWHPLWEQPDTVSLRRGWEAIQRAESIGPATDREKAYVAALANFYRDWKTTDHRTRAVAYEKAMAGVHESFPADTEAAIFYALSLNATLQYSDKTLANQKKAGAILEPLYAVNPDHPGIAHYLIHSYDFPELARRGLPMADRYAAIAPGVPHALHMPSHIYVRLGMWDQSNRSNLACADASRQYANSHYSGVVYYDAVHAFDYLEYGYLQKAQDQKARTTRDIVAAIRKVSHPTQSSYYAITAVPARYALEHHAWKDAAALSLPEGWDWKRYPWTEATTHYARALGGARSGQLEVARKAIARLAEIRAGITNPGHKDWAAQIEAQRRTGEAWLALAEGKKADAVAQMKSAAALEDSTSKRPVTPGAVLPARELLGDMLLETKQPAEALAAYEQVLRDQPGRFNALAGAARAARAAGQADAARKYSKQLLELAKDGDGERPELEVARREIAVAN